jgi:hypothetical protein
MMSSRRHTTGSHNFHKTQSRTDIFARSSLLALHELIEHADCVLPIENEALFQMSAHMNNTPSTLASPGNPFDAMNNIVGELLCHLTASIRFEGTMNVDLNEISSTLVPFPSLHFLVASMCPLSYSDDGSSKASGRGHSTAPRSSGHTKEIDQMFVNCFERYNVVYYSVLCICTLHSVSALCTVYLHSVLCICTLYCDSSLDTFVILDPTSLCGLTQSRARHLPVDCCFEGMWRFRTLTVTSGGFSDSLGERQQQCQQ